MLTMTHRKEEKELSPEQVRRIREELGMTQQELAEELGCGLASVSRWERGEARPLSIYVRAMRELRGMVRN